MDQQHIRNVAIIAHVDHGKTTLVDQLFRQSGLFRDNQEVEERMMDSIDLERERGITIKAKNGACHYKDYLINIIDTPGHADFGGEVERVLKMADGALFLVDAAEGPMPQSHFVLKKAVALNLPVIVVVNKIDKPTARPDWAVDKVFDLLVKLNAPDHILDFKVMYASAKAGFAKQTIDEESTTITPIFDAVIKHIPAPAGNPDGPVQILVSSLSHSTFLGRLAIGKVTSGRLKVNQDVAAARLDGALTPFRVTKIYHFEGSKQVENPNAITGDIIALSGLEDIMVGETITDRQNPIPIPAVPIDPPTLSLNFLPNDSPFAGQEGEFVTSRHLRDRLHREILSDVALKVEDLPGDVGYKVSGRGELHLSILIEKMRREGYEFQVSKPTVVTRVENGEKLEPYEELIVTVEEPYLGRVMESLGNRRAKMIEMDKLGETVQLKFKVPTRGLLGYQSEFMSMTKGMGTLYYTFLEYDSLAGSIQTRKNGVLISKENGTTIAYALDNLQERGRLFLGPAVDVYAGQIIGENAREDDMIVNPCKGKKLTNMRASGSDDNILLTPPTVFSLEECLSFIKDDELVEVTPQSIRLRKLT